MFKNKLVVIIFIINIFLCVNGLTQIQEDDLEIIEVVEKVIPEQVVEPVTEWLKLYVENISYAIAIIGFLLAFKKKYFVFLKTSFHNFMRFNLLEDISKRIEYIDSELRFNGGSSLKDQVVKISNLMDNDFWIRPQPAFLCLDDGKNNQVSQAYCQMVSVGSFDELEKLNWRMFIDPMDIDGYDVLWESAFKDKQGFVTVVNIIDQYQEPRGKWRLRITPIKPMIRKEHEGYLFAGHYTPVDDLAKKIWDDHGWSI